MERKTNSNAWGEQFAEDVKWELFALSKAPREDEERPWLRDYKLDVVPHLEGRGLAVPSRAGWYRFLERMREREAARRVLSVETSKRIARGIQKVQVDKKLAADMFTGLSVDAASSGNDEAAKMLADAAAKYAAADLAEKKLELDRAAQATKEEQLRLAREKFEFDAAKAAMEKASHIRSISTDDSLSADEKISAVRAALFGEAAG